MSPSRKRSGIAAIAVGLALQAIYYLSIVALSFDSANLPFAIDAGLAFCYVLGFLLFDLGMAVIILAAFNGWKGWALVLKSMSLVSLIMSLVVMAIAFYAIVLMVPPGLWNTYQGWSSLTFTVYGAALSWLSFITLFLFIYVLLFKSSGLGQGKS